MDNRHISLMRFMAFVLCLCFWGLKEAHCAAQASTGVKMQDLPSLTVNIQADQTRIGMGRRLAVTATATLNDAQPMVGSKLLPYVSGKRWGAHDYTDSQGRATFHLPLPNPGQFEIQVQGCLFVEQWIWDDRTTDYQTVFLQGAFQLPVIPDRARLWVGADDQAEIFLNSRPVGDFGGLSNLVPVDVASLCQVGATSTLTRREIPGAMGTSCLWARSSHRSCGGGCPIQSGVIYPTGWDRS